MTLCEEAVRGEAVSGVTVIPAVGLAWCFDAWRVGLFFIGVERWCLVSPLVGVLFHG